MRYNFKRYCKDYEKIENYQKALKDDFINWCCHHRLETHSLDGERRDVDISYEELKALGMYYNRPPDELIFLTTREHNSLHHKGNKHMLGKHHSEESKKKMSEVHKEKNIWTKGRHWYNDGIINIRAKECPPGFVPGMLR